VIDHKPLVPILNGRRLDQIDNDRLLKMRIKLNRFNYTARFIQGKHHVMADAFSRLATNAPKEEDVIVEDDTEERATEIHMMITALTRGDGQLADARQQRILEAGERDPEYCMVRDQVLKGFPNTKVGVAEEVRPYWHQHENLSVEGGLVLRGCQLLIPRAERAETLRQLHAAHQGQRKTGERASTTVWWPTMQNELMQHIENCKTCREVLPRLPDTLNFRRRHQLPAFRSIR
jgi:hypothetical protein